MDNITVLARLVATEEDSLGYTTYVFECLDREILREFKYIMCTRFPNWDHRRITVGEEGFLHVVEIRAGIDKWFDGSKMIPYNYNNVQFLKFVLKPESVHHEFVM